ncbi:GntR family transcriptional regulator [Bradyrhizobium sp.]|uniref:GntR family transcriptional regulator n=1 Tax=Bradyrhizobium sp. TaxID=376 RepID=UPI0039E5D8D4
MNQISQDGRRSETGPDDAPASRAEALNLEHRSQEVYERLRTMIVTGEIRPNEPLIEADLAAKIGVSRTPIRESLQRLAADRLIVPRKRGWSVREYTAAEIQQSCEVRMALEGYAASLAAQRATDAELARIEEIHIQRTGLRAIDEEIRVRTNRQFHDAIIGAARNDRLRDAIFQTGLFYFNGPIARVTTQEELAAGNYDHGLILSALMRRDEFAAERSMRAHIRRTFSIFERTHSRI